jgi:hypothetical protein
MSAVKEIMMKRILLSFFCAVLVVSASYCQEISEKKELKVFSLSYSDWNVPSDVRVMVDARITGVFSGLGLFDVKGVDLRLDAGRGSEFIDKLKAVNESDSAVDEKYLLELKKSNLIVIPSLSFYDSIGDEGGGEWEVELQTLFIVINVQNLTTIAEFTIGTFGSGENESEALLEASEAISVQLKFELRNIEEFQLKTGIIEVIGDSRVIIELGRSMGLNVGDEFSIISFRDASARRAEQDKTGLLVVTDVEKEISYALVLYNNGQVAPGDQLREIPKYGVDFSGYGHGFIDATGISGGTIGIKAILSR